MKILLSLFSGLPAVAADPIHFLLAFAVLCAVIAIVIILVRWVVSLTGWVIPPPLLAVLGILLFIVLLMWIMNWSGVYRW